MSKIFIIVLIFTLPSPALSPVYNRVLFHFSLRTGEMAKSSRRVYVSAPIEVKANTKSFCCGMILMCVNPAP